MYPFARLAFQVWRHRADPPLALFEAHESRHVCWPQDLDLWLELNNGRTLTLYDLGRIPWANRLGFTRVLRERGWQVAVAGASARWRRRVHVFDRLRMRTRAIGFDDRFLYAEQSLWLDSGKARGECASHLLVRSAVTGGRAAGRRGIVPPAEVLGALGWEGPSPPLPAFAAAWVEAESLRPWPPMEPPPGGPA